MSEEPIHDRCAGLDDGPDLMPVDQFGDGGAAVADELRDVPGMRGEQGVGRLRRILRRDREHQIVFAEKRRPRVLERAGAGSSPCAGDQQTAVMRDYFAAAVRLCAPARLDL